MQNNFAKQEPISLEPISIHTNKRNGAFNIHRPPDTPTLKDIPFDVRKLINVRNIIRYWAHTDTSILSKTHSRSIEILRLQFDSCLKPPKCGRMPSMLLKTFIHKIVGRMNATALHIFQNRIFSNVYRNDLNNSNARKNMCLICVKSDLNLFIFLTKKNISTSKWLGIQMLFMDIFFGKSEATIVLKKKTLMLTNTFGIYKRTIKKCCVNICYTAARMINVISALQLFNQVKHTDFLFSLSRIKRHEFLRIRTTCSQV